MTKRQPIEWQIVKRKVGELTPHPKNPRIASRSGDDKLKSSMDELGLFKLPAISHDGVILEGHQRIKIMTKQHGEDYEVDVMMPNQELTAKQYDRILITGNLHAADWDWDTLNSDKFNTTDLVDWGIPEWKTKYDAEAYDNRDVNSFKEKNKEIDLDSMGEELNCKCPKCGFLFSN